MIISGGCNILELYSLSEDNVQDLGTYMLVTTSGAKRRRQFCITGPYYDICKKYATLRPAGAETTSFFRSYRKGKCGSKNMGVNTFGAMGRKIAAFLKLPNPGDYTGASFRKFSNQYFLEWKASLKEKQQPCKNTADAEAETATSVKSESGVDELKIKCEELDISDTVSELSAGNTDSSDESDFVEEEEDPLREISEKTERKYEKAYNAFVCWQKSKNISTFSENVLIDYFKEVKADYTPSSLYSLFFKLKRMLRKKHKIRVEDYTKLRLFLKKVATQTPNKDGAKAFSPEQIKKFLHEAPDAVYLAAKVSKNSLAV